MSDLLSGFLSGYFHQDYDIEYSTDLEADSGLRQWLEVLSKIMVEQAARRTNAT